MDEREARYRAILQGAGIDGRVPPFPQGDPLARGAALALAPALGAFTQWVLGWAIERGVRRLYFLSRDGWFPWGLAQRLCREWRLPVECRYLYASRGAWRRPALHLDHRAAAAYLCRPGGLVTPEEVFHRAGLSPEEGARFGALLGLEPAAPLTRGQLSRLQGSLLGCPAFLRAMDACARKALPLLAGYLRQEGLWAPVPWALVDSGWMGGVQGSLGLVLGALGWRRELWGCYWGLYRPPGQGRFACFAFSPGRELAAQSQMRPAFFETVFSAPQGTVLGYAQGQGRWVPLLGAPSPRLSGLERLGQVFSQYGALLAREGRPLSLRRQGERERAAALGCLSLLMDRPTREEAEAFGALPFSEGPGAGDAPALASPLTRRQLWENSLSGRVLAGGRIPAAPWPEGCAALSCPSPAGAFSAFARARWGRALTLALLARGTHSEEGSL